MPILPTPTLCRVYLENREPGHHKFYELTLIYSPDEKSQCRLVSRYGKIGARGTPTDHPGPSWESVLSIMSAKLKEKKKHLYQITENPVKFFIPEIRAEMVGERSLLRDIYNKTSHILDLSFGASAVLVDKSGEQGVDPQPDKKTAAFAGIFARRKKEAMFDI